MERRRSTTLRTADRLQANPNYRHSNIDKGQGLKVYSWLIGFTSETMAMGLELVCLKTRLPSLSRHYDLLG